MLLTGFIIVIFLIVIFNWIQVSEEISAQEKAEVSIAKNKNTYLEKINSAKTISNKTHNFDNINEYYWRNVPAKDRPPESFEHWKREKQANYLNVNVIDVFLEKKDKSWIYNDKLYNTPEEAVENYFINEHNYTKLPNMFFNYMIHAIIRKLPNEYNWINIDGKEFVEHRYQTYRKQAINEANKLSIYSLIKDSKKTDDYFCNKGVNNPVSRWGLIKDKKTLSKWYNALGIEFIKRHTNNIIKGGSPGGWPDLSFIDVNRKKIILYEVKTENDRMRPNQYSCYKEINKEICFEYALVFLNIKRDIE